MSRVMCQVTCHVTCHVSYVTINFFFFSDKVVKLIGGGSVINGAPHLYHVILAVLALLDTLPHVLDVAEVPR